jgi:hypothetical protein
MPNRNLQGTRSTIATIQQTAELANHLVTPIPNADGDWRRELEVWKRELEAAKIQRGQGENRFYRIEDDLD